MCDWLQVNDIVRTETFETILQANRIVVSVGITQVFDATIDFTWNGRLYSAQLKSGGITRLVGLFHAYTGRDPTTFGIWPQNQVDEPPLTRVQKEAIVLQACKDVMACLDQIADVYQTDLMAYSLWYREAHPEKADYSSYITRKTCHFVVHAQIWAPKLPRVVIKFGQDAQI
jgi:hypothetical protein